MKSEVQKIYAVFAAIVLALTSSSAFAQRWVYDGAIVSTRGPTKARALLAAGLPKIPLNFSSQSLSSHTVLVSEKQRGVALLETRGDESPKLYSRKNNPCKRAKMRRALKNLSGARCEPNYAQFATTTPNDPLYNRAYENTLMSLESAWGISTGKDDLVVVVIDTGVLYTHPDLADNIWINKNEIPGNGVDDDNNSVIDDVYGVNTITWAGPGTVSSAGNPLDDHGHGTHCAGIIGARGNNGQGATGVNWRVKIAAAKFLSSSGSGSTSNAIKAVQYATMLRLAGHKVVVTNNSWGGGGFSQALLDAIQAGNAAGIMFVAAAGNAAVNTDSTPFYPAALPSDAVVAVASVTQTGALSSFSNYGATSVDIAAPGSSILSTYLNNQYAYLSGTSMAAPQVSGVVALAQSMCSDRLLSVSDMRSLILSTGTIYPNLSGKVATSAIANAYQALLAASALCNPTPPATATPTLTPTPTTTPSPSTTPSSTPIASPSATAPAVPTFTRTSTPTSIPTATSTRTTTPTPTNTAPSSGPILKPSATTTPVPPTATPTASSTPIPLSLSPNKDLTAGAQVTVSIAAPKSQIRATLQVSGSDGRFIYTCPAFAATLTNGSLTSSVTLPTASPRLNYFALSATFGSKPQTQRATFKDAVNRPTLKEGAAYAAALCLNVKNALAGPANKKVGAKARKRKMRVRSLRVP